MVLAMMGVLAIAASGITLFLYAFKFCEHFESHTIKAINRINELADRSFRIEATKSELEDAKKSQEHLIQVYTKYRLFWVLIPNILLVISLVSAIPYTTSFFNNPPLLIPWIIFYLAGAIMPIIGASIAMIKQPTRKYLEIKKKYTEPSPPHKTTTQTE